MLKMALLDCAINEQRCSVDGGRGICPLFWSPFSFLGAAGIALEKHYSFRGPINDRISHGTDNKLNETYYTNYHLPICKNRPMVQCH